MAAVEEPLNHRAFHKEPRDYNPHFSQTLPILPPPSTGAMNSNDAMDVTPSRTTNMAPPANSSPNGERSSELPPSSQSDPSHATTNGGSNQPVGAAAAAQQPKVVQTAFIHKLYNMLEDQTIQHLISWSNTSESFVMSPSSEFSKVLAQYFKHTNISSFVRQLNMYGFHKVSDVFHTGSPDSPLWEFKHGQGNFKRGDLIGLREIKRRASRHALIHRDSFSNAPKMPTPTQPGTVLETMQDPIETRLNMLEWNTHDLNTRLARTEEAYSAVLSKCQALLEGLTKCHRWNQEVSSHILTLVPDPDNPVHRDVFAMRQEIARHLDHIRSLDDTQDPLFTNKQLFYQPHSTSMEPPVPISPSQRAFDESRRPSLQSLGRLNSFKAPVPSHLQVSPRRYGSIGTGNGAFSPSSTRPTHLPPPPPPQPHGQHPLATMSSPPTNLARRHTSADIRVHGWNGSTYNPGSSPYASGHSSTAWPSSPRAPANAGDQQLRDALASYELPRAAVPPSSTSRHASPPPPHETSVPGPASSSNNFSSVAGYANLSNDAGWQIPGARSAFAFKGLDASGPPTRRSSMASNVHSLLNPADTAEREEEGSGGLAPHEVKRKRII